MRHLVLRFGDFRELLTDNVPEMVGDYPNILSKLLQTRQVNLIPYRLR